MFRTSKKLLAAIALSLGLVFAVSSAPAALVVQAAPETVAVRGTVGAGSKTDLLYLNTSSGQIQIKIDSNTDVSQCHMIFQDMSLKAEIYNGGDGYMHAARLAKDKTWPDTTVNTGVTVDVAGEVSGASKDETLFLSTAGGTMTIRLDKSTEMAGPRILMQGDKVIVTVALGNDGFLHAVKVQDGRYAVTNNGGTVGGGNGSTTTVNGIQMTNVAGKVRENTVPGMLYLETAAGNMEIKIDSNADTTNCKALYKEQTVTAAIYRGNDAYMHAGRLTDHSGGSYSGATVDKVNTTVVTGKVSSGTTAKLMKLSTSAGMMEIRFDADTAMTNIPVVTVGREVNVKIGRGSDAYMHAIEVTDKNLGTYSSGAAAPAVSTATWSGVELTTVQGTVDPRTTTSLMYLATSGGTMEIVLDLGTDVTACRALLPGQVITVAFYRGADSYNHAAKITDSTVGADVNATLDTSSRTTVAGIVANGTGSTVIKLQTAGGLMEIKLDRSTDLSSCRVLYGGKPITVTILHGSDGYWHAEKITD